MSNSLTLTRRNCGQYIEKNMELPQNCRSISAETFFNRPDIRSVVFPYEMEQIGNKAFQGCSRLSRIELPEHLQKLGIGVFSGRLFYSMQVRVSKPIQGFRSLMK